VAIRNALAHIAPAEVAELRRAWTADERTVVLGSIGRLMPEKGMDVLVRAFRAAFPQADAPVRLVIVGGGPPEQAQALQALVDGDARITVSGPPPEIALYYRAFDTYVSAARFEPFGLTILEAMEAGCGLVVTRTQGPREFLTETSVLWAEPDDEATLASRAHGNGGATICRRSCRRARSARSRNFTARCCPGGVRPRDPLHGGESRIARQDAETAGKIACGAS
jgi:glycosyltransferase involved in cell wall biosynthesis